MSCSSTARNEHHCDIIWTTPIHSIFKLPAPLDSTNTSDISPTGPSVRNACVNAISPKTLLPPPLGNNPQPQPILTTQPLVRDCGDTSRLPVCTGPYGTSVMTVEIEDWHIDNDPETHYTCPRRDSTSEEADAGEEIPKLIEFVDLGVSPPKPPRKSWDPRGWVEGLRTRTSSKSAVDATVGEAWQQNLIADDGDGQKSTGSWLVELLSRIRKSLRPGEQSDEETLWETDEDRRLKVSLTNSSRRSTTDIIFSQISTVTEVPSLSESDLDVFRPCSPQRSNSSVLSQPMKFATPPVCKFLYYGSMQAENQAGLESFKPLSRESLDDLEGISVEFCRSCSSCWYSDAEEMTEAAEAAIRASNRKSKIVALLVGTCVLFALSLFALLWPLKHDYPAIAVLAVFPTTALVWLMYVSIKTSRSREKLESCDRDQESELCPFCNRKVPWRRWAEAHDMDRVERLRWLGHE